MLSLSLSQGCSLELITRQEILLSQKCKLSLMEEFTNHVNIIRKKSDISPEYFLNNVLKKIIEKSPYPFNEIIQSLFYNKKTQSVFLKNNLDLIFPAKKNPNKVAIDYFYHTQRDINDDFVIENNGIRNNIKINYEKFITAINHRELLDNEYEVLKSFLEKDTGINSYRMDQMREIQNAILISDLLKDHIENMTRIIDYMMNFVVDDERLLHSFLQDSVLLEKLDFIVSERLMNRLVDSFSGKNLNENSRAKNYITPFINSVGEFVLMSMGIISPEIFTLKKYNLNRNNIVDFDGSDDYNDPEVKEHLEYENLLNKYNLKKEGCIFWNRYSTLNKKPTAITDEKIREFITKTVREDADTIIEAIDFYDFFEKLKYDFLNIHPQDRKDIQVKKDFFFEKCINLFNKMELQETISNLIKTKWSSQLTMFYK